MPIPIGTRLGVYEIRELLGVGGMGEVYRAHDTKLNREVALKVLPPAFARDPERIIRFRREAQLLAQLNHPNIAAIYNFEETPEARFLVMELVLGETLREQIKRGPLPVEETLTIGKQIAEALEHAHEKPIIHRDLKPANVKVTPQGLVKVLDFGLAKAFGGDKAAIDPHDLPTGSQHGTLAGTILGTPGYMSPEQASGKEVDKRTDIWALGCVLYELLTGKLAFPGDTVTEIIAGVLRGEPDWSALPEATPPHLRSFLRRCLEKDAKRRFRDAADIAIQLEEVKTASASVAPVLAKPVARPVWRRALPFVLTGLVAAAIAAGIAIWNRPVPASRPVSRFAVQLPVEDRIEVFGAPSVAISPDGSKVVYAGAGTGGQLYLRSLESPEVKPIPGTQGAGTPFFSLDGQWLGFFASGKLMKVALSGGPSLTLCEPCGGGAHGATWGPDDTIVFSTTPEGRRNLFRVAAAGGMPTVLAMPDPSKGEIAYGWPEFLPGGKTLLFTIARGSNWDNAQIAVLSLETGERRVLVQGGTYPHYAPTGHLVYYRAGTLMAVPFDLDRLEVTGAPVPILEGVMSTIRAPGLTLDSGAAQFGFSRTGSLVYVAGLGSAESALVWVDRKGAVEPLGAPPRAYRQPVLSPDGRQVAVRIDGQTSDIWIYDIARGTLTRLTFEGNNRGPHWMADGKRIAFTSNRGASNHLFSKLADGTGPEEQLTNHERFRSVASISPDGKLAFATLNPMPNDLVIFELRGERKMSIFLKDPFEKGSPAISPDGRWVAYLSFESGREEIYVRPFPGPEGKWQISTEGGVAPVWARNGRELFYGTSPTGKLMAVDIRTEPTFQAGTPRVVLKEGFRLTAATQGANFDVSPDGQRFLMVQGSDANLTQLNVVLNWFEELKRRVPAGR